MTWRCLVVGLLLTTSVALSAENSAWALGVGYREDALDWAISGPSGVPKEISKLTWKDLRMWQVALYGQGDITSYLSYSAYVDYAKIVSGKNIDSDFLEPDPKSVTLRSDNSAKGGECYDLSAALGCPVHAHGVKMEFLLGYAYMAQNLVMRDGSWTINKITGENGPFPGLDSSYDARWYGPWVGMDFVSDPLVCLCLTDLKLWGSVAYHWVQYHAKAHWNLRPDLPDGFTQTGDGDGWRLALGAEHPICAGWMRGVTLGISGQWSWFCVHDGQDRSKLWADMGNGPELFRVKVKMPYIHWRSAAIMAYLACAY